AAEHPLDERVAGQYLLALHRAGRTADALAHYRRHSARLADRLGIDPGAPLRELHQRLLAADPALAGAPARPARRVPRQLPAAPVHFTGRDAELAALTAAVHRFPDGQLFVDLRGFSPDSEPMDPAVAVRGFLDTLGVEPGRVPVGLRDRVDLFRRLLAGRRVLVVLDNAADAAQVAPLLPADDSCTVVTTSRNRLSDLVTGHGARHLPLDVLSEDEAATLLTARLGDARVRAEPGAVAELVRLCGGFPLALGIVAARGRTEPHLPLAALAAELRELGLDALDDDPTAGLPTVLSWSRRALDAAHARAFALLGIAPGPDVGLPTAANLLGLPAERTGALLRGLEDASLLTRDARGRYRMHDLVRRYAADTARHGLTGAERDAALRRAVDFLVRTAVTADRLLAPYRTPIHLDDLVPGTRPEPLADQGAALAWLTAEHPSLLAAQRLAAERGWHRRVWQVAWALQTFHIRRAHLQDGVATWRAALTAAEHLDDPGARIGAHRSLGVFCANTGAHDEAVGHLREAVALAERTGDRAALSHAHHALARAWETRGDDRRALEHAELALGLFRELGNRDFEVDALNSVGWFEARLGEFERARAHCGAALELAREDGDEGMQAASSDSLGYIAHHSGRHAEALEHYGRATALFRANGDTHYLADCLDRLGRPHVVLGQRERARAVWREALELYLAQHREEDAERVRRQLAELGG
ncbi:ATP-binding protein, partial [Saccharothrix syringae]|uniref:ATP-binding protein n=1 Tax=Saccharothrix syringae TaxID=103733 RepID=UPI0005257AD8